MSRFLWFTVYRYVMQYTLYEVLPPCTGYSLAITISGDWQESRWYNCRITDDKSAVDNKKCTRTYEHFIQKRFSFRWHIIVCQNVFIVWSFWNRVKV